MKQSLLAALLLCALLLGCGQVTPAQEFPTRLTPTKETENDKLRCYPLDAATCRFLTLGEDLLVIRPQEQGAMLLRCTGKGLVITARTEVPSQTLLCGGGESILCYDPATREALLYSQELTLLEQLPLPDCLGTPLANTDGSCIYYCTAQALMALDTDTGIHRPLRQQEGLTLTAVLEKSGLLICSAGTESLYIQMEDGALAQRSPTITGAAELGSRVHLCVKCGFLDCLYLGQTMFPLCAGWSFLTFLPAMNAALVLQEEHTLVIYDLSTGNRLAEICLGADSTPESAWATEDGRVFFTAGGAMYQWEPTWTVNRETRAKITALYTQDNPSQKGLEQCRQRGAYLKNQYGLEILLHTEAVQVLPPGVEAEPEHITATVLDTLAGVASTLGRFPTELVKTAFSGCGRVYLCPVRSIRVDGTEQLGLQFWSGRDCYLLIAASDQVDRAVIQVFTPLLDRQILMKSSALDNWDSLNPPGFSYGAGAWDAAAFASPDCTESPAADRAGLLYAALESGNRELFLSAQLQNKLQALSTGLRQAFPLPSDVKRPWEQYLWKQ